MDDLEMNLSIILESLFGDSVVVKPTLHGCLVPLRQKKRKVPLLEGSRLTPAAYM
jgi:hypothetical protein